MFNLVKFCQNKICVLNTLTFHCNQKSNTVRFGWYFCLVSIGCDVLWSSNLHHCSCASPYL